jgi:hypothetical protein
MEGSNSSKKGKNNQDHNKDEKEKQRRKVGDLISNTTTIDDLALTKTGTCLN